MVRMAQVRPYRGVEAATGSPSGGAGFSTPDSNCSAVQTTRPS